jgi:hypothetical protein
MTISTRTRIAGATATLGLLLGFTACGSETVTDPGSGVAIQTPQHGRHSAPKHGGVSADTAERQAAANKARAERADALRAAHGQQPELKQQGDGRTLRR